MNNELPPLWVRKRAADLANKAHGRLIWTGNDAEHNGAFRALCDMIAKYEKPPVDEAELKRRQDARKAAGVIVSDERYGWDVTAADIANGDDDDNGLVQSAYIALCLFRDGTDPIPVEEWVA